MTTHEIILEVLSVAVYFVLGFMFARLSCKIEIEGLKREIRSLETSLSLYRYRITINENSSYPASPSPSPSLSPSPSPSPSDGDELL